MTNKHTVTPEALSTPATADASSGYPNNNIDIAYQLVQQIPPGRWTSDGELAEAVMIVTGRRDTNGYRIASVSFTVRMARGTGYATGTVSTTHRRGHPNAVGARRRRNEALRSEGCYVDDRSGAADPARFITASRLLEHAGTPAAQLHAAREADPDLAARVAAKREARRRERKIVF